MSTVEEAARCIEKLNGVVRSSIYVSSATHCSCELVIGIERPPHPRRLLCY